MKWLTLWLLGFLSLLDAQEDWVELSEVQEVQA